MKTPRQRCSSSYSVNPRQHTIAPSRWVHPLTIGSFISHRSSFRRLCEGKLHCRHRENCFTNTLSKAKLLLGISYTQTAHYILRCNKICGRSDTPVDLLLTNLPITMTRKKEMSQIDDPSITPLRASFGWSPTLRVSQAGPGELPTLLLAPLQSLLRTCSWP